jgi:anti-anti-sigma factor
MRNEPFSYATTDGARPGTLVLKLTGPLTMSNIFGLQAELRGLQPELLVVDLTESPYMDSAGLGVLTNYYVASQREGRRVALVGVNERIAALLEMTHVDTLLKSYPSLEAAEA